MSYIPLAVRNRKEILRDPISILLGVALPLAMLTLFALLGRSAPLAIFQIENLAPAIIVFGFAFLTMFTAVLIAKDKQSAFLMRLFASPLSAADYILSYTLPLAPLALLQGTLVFLLAFALGMAVTVNILLAALVLIPMAAMSVLTGLLFGSLFTESQVAGVGSIYITLTSLFSGAWMDLDMVGGIFKTIGYALPHAHAIDAARAALAADYAAILPHVAWTIGYALVIGILAAFAFKRGMKA
jgi:ABC-2 type transport system permease protein